MTTHGGNIYRLAEEIRMPERKIIDFSASINPLGPSNKVKAGIRKNLKKLAHYPDPDTARMKKALGRFHGIDPGLILCGNGSTEMIYLTVRGLKPGNILVTAPAFSEYEKAFAAACGKDGLAHSSRIKYLALDPAGDFTIDPGGFISAMEGCDMAFLCNPNNPTGLLLKRDEVLRIAGAAEGSGCLFVVDEAFMDFCPGESVIREAARNPFLIVLRSMTKFYALPGLRIGYGVFPREIADVLRRCKEPWSVNSLAQDAAIEAIRDKVYGRKTLELTGEEKHFLQKELGRMGVKVFPSDANFLLLKLNKGREISHGLRKKGILVRQCDDFRGLDSDYIRIAVRSHRENSAFLKELGNLLKRNPGINR